ncbi:glyoxalase [Halorubrum sp. Ea8]|uniref:glyoxalase n=1 Tax=Halorubrum sp. Ea8 TaxID=1383841 RepID=UPI000B97DFA8|nr:glyoxalase [Halorubrum sp. Ea8]OYR47781.1 glyoxalase [Halorubrum sp. Ea8]
MSGIVFHGTENRGGVVDFYREELGAETWLEQPDCTILRHDNLLFGFCDRDETEACGTFTFVYPDRETVDDVRERLAEASDRRDDASAPGAVEEPRENERYDIYQFFAEDPDGRTVECQAFLADDVGPI